MCTGIGARNEMDGCFAKSYRAFALISMRAGNFASKAPGADYNGLILITAVGLETAKNY